MGQRGTEFCIVFLSHKDFESISDVFLCPFTALLRISINYQPSSVSLSFSCLLSEKPEVASGRLRDSDPSTPKN